MKKLFTYLFFLLPVFLVAQETKLPVVQIKDAAGIDTFIVSTAGGVFANKPISYIQTNLGLVDGTFGVGQIAFGADANTLTSDANFVFSVGKMGIGTATPNGKLDVVAGVLNTSSDIALNVSTTLTSTGNIGNSIIITGHTNTFGSQVGTLIDLQNGDSGQDAAIALKVKNNSIGGNLGQFLGFSGATDGRGGIGLYSESSGGGQTTYGIKGRALNGNGNLGVYGIASPSTSQTGIGVSGFSYSAIEKIVGGYFWINSNANTNPVNYTKGALLANNGDMAAPIIIAYDNDTEIFRIDDGGNVGIGITTPSQKLEVDGLIFSSTLGTDGIRLKPDITTSWVESIGSNLGLAVDGSEKVTILANGNVGIGVTPVVKLQVSGDIVLSSNTATSPFLKFVTDDADEFRLLLTNSLFTRLAFTTDGKFTEVYDIRDSDGFGADGNTIDQLFKIEGNNGSVLNIGSQIWTITDSSPSTESSSWTIRTATNNFLQNRLSVLGDGGFSFGVGYQSATPGLNNAVFEGNVGIGTTTPTAKLEIAGDISAAAWGLDGIQFQATAATYTDNSLPAGSAVINANFNSFKRPTLAATNININTTFASTLYIENAPLAGTNQTINSPYALWVDDGNVRFDGNVGIGTSTPTQKLEVKGGSSRVSYDGTAPFDMTAIGQFVADNVNTSSVIELKNTVAGAMSTFILSDSTAQQWAIGSNSIADAFTITDIQAGSLHRLLIDVNGNIGINKTNPTEKLDVNGNIKGTFAHATTDVDKFLVDSAGIIKHRTGVEMLSDLTISSGTYTPTITCTGCFSSDTIRNAYAGFHKYIRVGNIVTVTGKFGITGGGSTGWIGVDVTLPVASNFTNASDVIGVVTYIVDDATTETVKASKVRADTAADLMKFEFHRTNIAEFTISWSVQYEIK